MRPVATFIVGAAGIAVWATLVLMAGRSVGNEETSDFEIEEMPTEWAEPATGTDDVTDGQSGTATAEPEAADAMADGTEVLPE